MHLFKVEMLRYVLVTKKRQQRLGVVCVSGCPFKLYASWDKGLAAYIVKLVTPQHTCQRNMDGKTVEVFMGC